MQDKTEFKNHLFTIKYLTLIFNSRTREREREAVEKEKSSIATNNFSCHT